MRTGSTRPSHRHAFGAAKMAAVDVAGFLLTGGASSRLGRDKATLPVAGGGTLATRTAALLAAASGPALELGPGCSGLPNLPDPPGPRRGPLVALAAGVAVLRAAGVDSGALVVATDLPGLTGELLEWLARHPAEGSVVPVTAGHPQWLCARYGPDTLGRASSLVEAGHRAMHHLGEAGPLHLAPEAEWKPLAGGAHLGDVDLPSDLSRLTTVPPG